MSCWSGWRWGAHRLRRSPSRTLTVSVTEAFYANSAPSQRGGVLWRKAVRSPRSSRSATAASCAGSGLNSITWNGTNVTEVTCGDTSSSPCAPRRSPTPRQRSSAYRNRCKNSLPALPAHSRHPSTHLSQSVSQTMSIYQDPVWTCYMSQFKPFIAHSLSSFSSKLAGSLGSVASRGQDENRIRRKIKSRKARLDWLEFKLVSIETDHFLFLKENLSNKITENVLWCRILSQVLTFLRNSHSSNNLP